MKRIFWCAGILLLISTAAQSQIKSKKTKTKQAAHSQTASNKETKSTPLPSNTITLNTITSYPAKAKAKTKTNTLSVLKNNYTISDPILTTLDARANGANIRFNKSGIIGMPKRAYGFANGRITFNTNGAVTSGTQTGSGAVGTGTSLGTFGSMGAPMNVNGKSPYAGINMWGNAMNMIITQRDSSVRLTPLKKQ